MAQPTSGPAKWEHCRKSLSDLNRLLHCERCGNLKSRGLLLGCQHLLCTDCAPSTGSCCPVCKSFDWEPRLDLAGLLAGYKDLVEALGPAEQDENKPLRPSGDKVGGNESATPRVRRPRKNSVESLDASTVAGAGRVADKRNAKGETALHAACARGDAGRVADLLRRGANPNTKDHAGSTPLHDAVCRGDEAMVRLLLAHGADAGAPGDANETPLHDAVACGAATLVRLLRRAGADAGARNGRGLTARDLCPNDNDELKAALEERPETAASAASAASADADAAAVAAGASTSAEASSNVPASTWNDQPLLVVGLDLDKKTWQRVTKLGRQLSFKTASTASSAATHVLVRVDAAAAAADSVAGGGAATPQDNVLFYSAFLQGQAVVDFQWIEDSERAQRLLDPAPYELDASLRRCRAGAEERRRAAQRLPGLFNNCRFFLHGDFSNTRWKKSDVTQWIRQGGGQVLTRMPNPETIDQDRSVAVPYHTRPDGPLARCSHYVLYDDERAPYRGIKYNMSHLKALPVHWLVDCIHQFRLVDPPA